MEPPTCFCHPFAIKMISGSAFSTRVISLNRSTVQNFQQKLKDSKVRAPADKKADILPGALNALTKYFAGGGGEPVINIFSPL